LNAVIWLTKNKSVSELPALVLAGGELLLISTAVAADAIGDLVASGPENRTFKVLAVGGCTISLLFAALWYAANSALRDTGQPINVNMVTKGSTIVFVFTVLAAGSCKWLAKE
jgi:hypothetical protein